MNNSSSDPLVAENPPSPSSTAVVANMKGPTPDVGPRPSVTTGVTSTLQSNLVELISRALGSALEPVAKLENEYDLISDQNLQYKDTNAQLNEMLLAAQANLAERDKLNRELRHQKNKLEEQHDRVLREKRRLDQVDEKLQNAQQQLLDERKQAGLRQDNNERSLTENTIRINELAEEATQYKHQLNKAKLEKKELQKLNKEKDDQAKQNEIAVFDLNKEIEQQKQKVAMHTEMEQKARFQEKETVEKLNSRVGELEEGLKEQTEARARDQIVFNKDMLDLKEVQKIAMDEKEAAAEEELAAKNDQLLETQEKLRKQAEIVKNALEEKEKASSAKERAERMFARMAEEHNVQSSELQIMTEHSSRWETQVKEKTTQLEALNKKVALIETDLSDTRALYTNEKEKNAEAARDLDAKMAAHKEEIATVTKEFGIHEEELRTQHIEDLHQRELEHEGKAKELTNTLIKKQEHITKLEAELSGVKHAHEELVDDMQQMNDTLEKETERFSKRTAELEKALEKESRDRAVDKATMQKELQAQKQLNAVNEAESEATVQAVKNKLSMVQGDLADAKAELQKQMEKMAEMVKRNEELQGQQFEAEKSLKRLTAEHNRAVEELSTVTELNATFESDVAKGKNRVRVLEVKLGQAQEDMNKMKQANIKLRQSVQEKQKMHDELHSTKNNEITQLIKQHNEEREILKRNNTELALDRNREREALQSDKEKVKTSKESDIRVLEKDLQSSQREFVRVEKEYKEYMTRAQEEDKRQEARIAELDKLLKKELDDRASDSISFQEQVQVLKNQSEMALKEEEEESSMQITSLQEQLAKVNELLKETQTDRDDLSQKNETASKGRDRAEKTLKDMNSEYDMQFKQLSQQTEQSSTLETQIHSQRTDITNKQIQMTQKLGDLTKQEALVAQLQQEIDDNKARSAEILVTKENDIAELQKMLSEEEEAKHVEAERAEQAEHALDRRSKAFNKELEAKQLKLRELYEVMEASAVSYQVQGKDTGDTLDDLKLPLIREPGALGELNNTTGRPTRPPNNKKGFAKRMQGRGVKDGSQSARQSSSR